MIVISTLLTGYIKCGIDRDRPDFEFEGVEFPVEISRDTFALFCEGGFDASYPSGHAARAMIFGIILGYALSERFPRGAYCTIPISCHDISKQNLCFTTLSNGCNWRFSYWNNVGRCFGK